MKDRTAWFTPKHKPVRPGLYECVIKLLDCDFIVLIKWHPYHGWDMRSTSIKCWRGLTVEEYMKRRIVR
jgi:hypothetical protein